MAEALVEQGLGQADRCTGGSRRSMRLEVTAWLASIRLASRERGHGRHGGAVCRL